MSLGDLTETVKSKMGSASITGTIKFDLGDTGVIRIDGTSSPATVDNEDGDSDCTIKVAENDFREIMDGNQDAQAAFMMGKLKVEGDMSVAMQLAGAM